MISRINSPHQLGRLNQITKRKSGDVTPWYLAGGISPADCVAAYQPKGAASYAASKANLTGNTTYDLTEGTAPTWSAGVGLTFNGSNQYLRTNYYPSKGANLSIIVRAYQLAGTDIQTIIGLHANSSPYNGVFLRLAAFGSLSYNRYANDGTSAGISTATTGDHVIGVAGREGFLDGVSEQTFSSLAQAFPAYDLYIGAVHYSSPIQFFKGDVIAVAIYETVLTALQVAKVTAAMAAL